jgi:uncharacterized membrane protein
MAQLLSLFRRKPLLDAASSEQVVASIRAAEARTTGEIRVYLESKCLYVDAMHRAEELFLQLGMYQTRHRNAVLVYVALTDHQFALYGDVAIYEAGGSGLWEEAAEALRNRLAEGDITGGLCGCINLLGTALAAHFPPDPAVSKNELPDEIVFGK